MKISILNDQNISQNASATKCSYPQSTVLDDGTIACIYREGTEKHSYDGVFKIRTSTDQGHSWTQPTIIFDGRQASPPLATITGGICQTPEGSLMATLSMVDASRPDVYLFSEEGFTFQRTLLKTFSHDRGRTWSQPETIDMSPYPHLGVTTKPFCLRNQTMFFPFELKTELGNQATVATVSRDSGQTFEPFTDCARDLTGRLNLCDAHFAELPDGRLLMLLWTFIQGEEETIPVHQAFSEDGGKSWTAPESTSLEGQIAAPLALGDKRVIAAVNYRKHPQQGIRLYISENDGQSWQHDHPIQMWDLLQQKCLGQPLPPQQKTEDDKGVWKELQNFTFGTPDLIQLADQSIMMSYYATINGNTHVRTCRFTLES